MKCFKLISKKINSTGEAWMSEGPMTVITYSCLRTDICAAVA